MSQQHKEIMQIRRDISIYLLHCTRGREEDNVEAFQVLKEILFDGFLKATRAPYKTHEGEDRYIVKGPNPVVCFTEQPLKYFFETVKIDKKYRKERYTEFAIAVRKGDLFQYGGRPVIYADTDVLEKLPDDLKYLFVSYNPNAILDYTRNYQPIDFTHEREWRVCPNPEDNKALRLFGQEQNAVPLQLPTFQEGSWLMISQPKDPRFAVLVDSEDRRRELKSWIRRNAPQISQRGSAYWGNRAKFWPTYWDNYAEVLKKAPILSFEKINDASARDELTRLEDFVNDDFTLKDFLYPKGF